MTHSRLPRFSVRDWGELLDGLSGAGYELLPVESMPDTARERAVYLRHDIDLHVPGVEQIAAVERERGLAATYFVPLTLHFNPFFPENRDVLRGLLADGHRIGLHYDLQTYPQDEERAWEHLEREVAMLSELVGEPVRSICMHFPWGGREDFFRHTERHVHPHAPRYDAVTYVSDSCRAWRDETLLRCFGAGEPIERMLLNTHPELWLGGAEEGREEFLNHTLLENTVRQHRAYITEYMGPAWEAHPAPKLHDARERRERV